MKTIQILDERIQELRREKPSTPEGRGELMCALGSLELTKLGWQRTKWLPMIMEE